MMTGLAPAEELRDIRRGMAQAGDAQVLQVVRMVDALDNRGATDAVLETVRARLRVIQPARPLRFARLLFTPVDPLIVPPNQWRAGTAFLPRTALRILAQATRSAIEADGTDTSALLARIDGMIDNATTAQTEIVRQAGGLIWPHAASALRNLANAPDSDGIRQRSVAEWAAEGLARAEFSPVARSLASVLTYATELHDHERALAVLSPPKLLAMLAGTERDGPRAWGMMASLLLIRVPHDAPTLLAAVAGKPALRPVAEAAAETALSLLEREGAEQEAGIDEGAPMATARQAAILNALSARPGDVTHRRRLAHTRAHLLEGSLQRLETTLHDEVVAPLKALPEEPDRHADAIDQIEASARLLRRFELEARRIGDAPKFEALAQDAERSVTSAPGLSPVNRARLIEILAGPAAASRYLAGG